MRVFPPGRKVAVSQTLNIRIPEAIWNAYEPPTKRVTRSTAKSFSSESTTVRPRIDRQAMTVTTRSNAGALEINETPLERIRPTDCKVKLWNFHYGGSKRVTKGEAKHEVEYSTPCLQPTCKTCLRWHPHLIRGPETQNAESQGGSPEQQTYHKPASEIEPIRPDIEPISPDIDPRILDGSWRCYQSEPSSATSAQSSTQLKTMTTPELTPVKQCFTSDLPFPYASATPSSPLDDSPTASTWRVDLPTRLVTQDMATTSAETIWRVNPRQQYMVRLRLLSREGKRRFVELLRRRERKLKKQIYDRNRRAKMKAEGR